MDKPLCPLCKTKHFAREPHEFKVSDVGAISVRDVPKRLPLVQEVQRPEQVAGGRIYKEGDKLPQFDRKTYQREYMRKWRKAKAGQA